MEIFGGFLESYMLFSLWLGGKRVQAITTRRLLSSLWLGGLGHHTINGGGGFGGDDNNTPGSICVHNRTSCVWYAAVVLNFSPSDPNRE